MKGEKARFLLNLGSGLAQLAASLLTSFLLFRVFLGTLGLEGTGAWVIVATVGDLLALLELGAGTAVVKFASAARGRSDEQDFTAIIRTSLRLGIVTGLLAVLAAGAIAAGFSLWFSIEEPLASAARVALLLVGIDMALTLATAAFRLALQSIHRYDVVNWLYVGRWLVRFTVLWLGLSHWGSLVFVAATGLACSALVNLLCVVVALRLVPGVREGLLGGDLGTWPRRVIGYSVWMLLAMVATRLAYSMDALIVGTYLGVRDVALYNAAWKVVEVIRAVGLMVVPFFLPMASQRQAEGRLDSVRVVYYQGTRLVVAVTYPLCALALGAGDSLLAVWLGPGFVDVYLLLWLLLTPQLAIMSVYPSHPIGYGLGRQKILVTYGVAVAAANLLLSLVLVRFLGMLGVALGTTITLAACALVNLYLHPRLIGFALSVYLRIVGRGLAPVAVAVVALRAVKPVLGDVPHLIVAGLTAGMVALAFLRWELTTAEREELAATVGDLLRHRGRYDRPASG